MQAAWDESMVISGEDTSMVEDVDDDLTRALAFYNQVQLHAQLHTKGQSCLIICATHP